MYEEAEVMNRRALAGRDKVLGEEHPDTLISVSNLTLVLSSQGKYQEAGTMNSRDRWGQTSLSRAAEGGHEATVVAVVVALLATGRVDADSKDTEGQTPLSKAAEGGHEVEAAVLLATGRCCRGLPSWAAVVGCRGRNEAVVAALLATGRVDTDSKDTTRQTPLLRAAEGGHGSE
jgi:hypothetical protein